MYQDEYRPPQVLRRQLDDHLLSTPDRLLQRFRGLESRHAKVEKALPQVDRLSKEKAALETQVTAQSKRVRVLEEQLSVQTAQLATQRNQLERFRQDAEKLKGRINLLRSELTRVRSSRSMRIGRAVLWPLHATQRLVGGGEPTGPTPGEIEAPGTSADNGKGRSEWPWTVR